jgi:hypothetical protein
MGASRDPMLLSPQRTLLPGVGIASAVLAGALMAVTLAASMMGMPLPLEDPPSSATTPLQIEARADAARSARTLATAQRPRLARLTPAAVPAAAVDDGARLRPDTSRRSDFEPAPRPRHVPLPSPPVRPGSPAPPAAPLPPATPPAAAPAAAPASPPHPLGTGVNAATDGVAATLRTLTVDLGARVQPLSPQLAAVVTQAGDALGDVVEGTGDVLGQLLGRPSA